jgi:hypothetical protein
MIPLHLPWQAPAAPKASWRLKWQRAQRWEFWPAWAFYPPIVAWIVYLGLKHRAPTAFTAANTALLAGGVVGEAKHEALQPLQDHAPELVAAFVLLQENPLEDRLKQAEAFAQQHGYPVVLKPNIGQRGRGVHIVRDAATLRAYLARFSGDGGADGGADGGDIIIQQYIGGEEFGVFLAKMPNQPLDVISIVHKVLPTVTGDGVKTLQQLIETDARARLIQPLLQQRWAGLLDQVLPAGEVLPLVDIGAHCRGSVFLNAAHLNTPALRATLERLVAAVPGYDFGRLDLRVPSSEHLARGEGIKVLELNGVTAESAHIYHPDTPLSEGYRAMFQQWQRAFEIGLAKQKQGAAATAPLLLLKLFREDLRRGAGWF